MGDEAKRFAGVDTTTPNLARMHDYFIGGKDNFAADREAAEAVLAIAPEVRVMAQEHQAFHVRVVRYLVDQGITQFVNLGAGLPTELNTHQLARSLVPEARVVYVGDDPVVLTHGRALLARQPGIAVVEGDVMHPADLLADPVLRQTIDLGQPVAVLLFAVLQYIADSSDPFRRVAELRDALPAGSHIVITHVVFDARPEIAEPIVDLYRKFLGDVEGVARTREKVSTFFDGLELVEPGLVYVRDWRPESPFAAERSDKAWVIVGVGRKT
ncbi:O-methyltransferase involved in polyketide biosynthesis [Nonomuraea polychroma]|uniref:O-methyltransferase involved in polyketide biosynthesis n=1 Tax=Nonomuraea polychroma TaxID=46176 RepID=A0A438MA80_9ACTN|nr:SAM-dependent methyltransferase [Nonomuraea polychroma]RVX42620.1 O-methyltransferase involved in polyketide biosynthesis [Nonomuraea polychroma]